MTDSNRNAPGGISPVAEEAKDRAASVVLAYRDVDWEAVERGEAAAVSTLLSVCEAHETARRFLEEDGGDLGARLIGGLDRFYAESISPKLQRPAVLLALGAQAQRAAAPQTGAAVPEAGTEDGLEPRERPQVTVGHTVRMNTGCGHLYVTVNESDDGKPFELFNHMGKAGGCAASQNEAIGRLISYALRCGARLEPLIKQLKGISCHRPAWGEEGKVSSCSDAIGKALEKYHTARQLRVQADGAGVAPAVGDGHRGGTGAGTGTGADTGNGNHQAQAQPVAFEPASQRWSGTVGSMRKSTEVHRVQGACVDCGSQLAFEEGCVKCHSCGFTECG